MATVPYVAPERPRRPRHHDMICPYDFFYALLNIWDRPQLAHLMRLLSWAMELIPTDLCDVSYWARHQHGVTPILTPTLVFLPPREAFERLAEVGAAPGLRRLQEAALVASMRLSVLVAFVGDYRVRMAIMASASGVNEAMQSRPPDPCRVWRFLGRDVRGACAAHFHEMANYDQRVRQAKEAAGKPPVLGLHCIRSSAGVTEEEEGEEEEKEGREPEALRLTQKWLTELKHLLFVPL
jgi:hypothetical protein